MTIGDMVFVLCVGVTVLNGTGSFLMAAMVAWWLCDLILLSAFEAEENL